MFPIDKRLVPVVLYPAPDVIPEILFAVDAVPGPLWDAQADLYELADAIQPYLEQHGASTWDFVWSMERHFSEPYGPLPKARQTFMAGIPDMFLSDCDQPGGQVDVRADFEVLAEPFQYDYRSEMPEEYVFWLRKLMFAHGECMMPYFGAEARDRGSMENPFAPVDEWSLVNAPDAETRLRLNNFFSEEFKHTYQFFRVYHNFDPALPVEIYEHEASVFRAYMAVDLKPTWLDRSIMNMMSDRFGVYQGFEWVQSSFAPLAQLSLKVVKDERGHSNMGYIGVRDYLARGGASAQAEARERIHDYWYPYFMAAFGSDDSANNTSWRRWGLKQHTNPQLREAYHREMAGVLASLSIDAPDPDKARERGIEMAHKARSGASQ